MNKEELRSQLLVQLRLLGKDSGYPWVAHEKAEELLCQWLNAFDEEMADTWREAKEEQCWLYA